MAQHTQLRFNLAVPPNPDNLASSFTSSPSPVVIQRMSLPQQPFTALSAERLALAVRLARRDLRQGTVPSRLQLSPATPASSSVRLGGGVPAHRTQLLSPTSCGSAPVIAQPPVLQSPYPLPPHRTLRHPPPPHGTFPHPLPPHGTLPHPPPPHGTHPRPPPPHGTHPRPPPPSGVESGSDACDATAAEIVRLRRELGLQLRRLKELAEREEHTEVCEPASSSGRGRVEEGEGSRVQWGVGRSEEERRQKRERERSARNTRMLYNLRQEVTGLQRELDAPRQKAPPTRVRHTRKSEAMHRLAAAHRAAVRILRHYTASTPHPRTPHPLPPELAFLLQKLSLLCAKLEVGGAKEDMGGAREAEEMELLLQQIKESSQSIAGGASAERQSPVSQEPGQRQPRLTARPALSDWSERARSVASRPAGTGSGSRGWQQSAVPLVHHAALAGEQRGRRRPRKVPPKGRKTGVLLHPQLRSQGQRKRRVRTQHFTQATHSSKLKQHRAVGKPPAPSLHPSVSHSRHPPHPHQHTSPQHLSSPHQRGRGQAPSSGQWTGRETLTTAAEQQGQAGREGESHFVETESQRGTGAMGTESVSVEDDGFGPWSTVEPMLVVGGRMQREGEMEGGGREGQREGELEGARGGGRESEQLHGRSINVKPGAVRKKTAAISDALLDDLLGEECQRLDHPAAAEGGAVLQRPDLVAMLSRIEELRLEEESIRQKWSTISYGDPFPPSRPQPGPSMKSDAPPPPVPDARPLPLSIPPSLLSSVRQYRGSRERYLRLTGVRTAGGFDPWGLVERLADDLLDGLVEEVCLELDQLCDSCVEQLYSHEFARPSDTPS